MINNANQEKISCTCPSCGAKFRAPQIATPAPKWPLYLLAAFVLAMGYAWHSGNKKVQEEKAKKPNICNPLSDEVISYINEKENPSCIACLQSAENDIKARRIKVRQEMLDTMALVKEGQYDIGLKPGMEGESDEVPQHKVFLDAYYIDKFEVTNANYMKFVKSTNGNEPVWMKPGGEFNITTGINAYYKRHGKYLTDGNYPVIGITWQNANDYCKWLNKRLPTEAEWETAAHGGTDTNYFFGNTSDAAGEYIWYKDNSGDGPHPVGQKKPNGYGLYDMEGNVWEWVYDIYDKNYYANSPGANPDGPRYNPDMKQSRVIRGGSWAFDADFGAITNRARNLPDKPNDDLGFRCVIYKSDFDKRFPVPQ